MGPLSRLRAEEIVKFRRVVGSDWLEPRVHLQRIIQLSAAKVKETSCIGAFRARVLIKELILDI